MNESTTRKIERILVYDEKPTFGVCICQTFTRPGFLSTRQTCSSVRSTTVDVDVDRAARGRLGDGMIYVYVVSSI